MNKLKIGIVCYPSYGGSGIIATELGINLANRGHSINFISYETPFRLTGFHQNIQFHEVDVQNYPLFKYPPYTLALTSKIIEVCEANKLDILHVHYAIPHSICAYLSRQILRDSSIKFVTTLHGTDITLVGIEHSYHKMVKFGIIESDKVSTVSNYLKQATIDKFKINKDISVIPNFVDTNKFSPNKRDIQCPLFEGGYKFILHISNFRPVKNITILIKAYNLILKKVNARLVLIGDGTEISTVRKLANKLGILDKICFLGKVELVEDLLPSADLFMLTSKTESFGLSLLEAMSCGVPTISSNVGGISEVVQHGETGFTFNPDDFNSMAEKAIEVLTNSDLHKHLSQNGRARAIKYFNINKIVDQYEQLYFDTLEL